MSIPNTGTNNPRSREQVFVDAAPRPRPRSAHVPNRSTGREQQRSTDARTPSQAELQSAHAELLADIDGIPVLVRFLLADPPGERQSGFAASESGLRSLFSATIAKAADRMGVSRLRREGLAKRPLATVELTASAKHLEQRLSALTGDTVLRVGPLELDLLDRTANRGGRHIHLRPREFLLLRYLVQRSGTLLTRATLLTEVWNYKFVPESNLVDVHMSNLRRKIDGPNEFPLIRNVRGAGFILSAPPSS